MCSCGQYWQLGYHIYFSLPLLIWFFFFQGALCVIIISVGAVSCSFGTYSALSKIVESLKRWNFWHIPTARETQSCTLDSYDVYSFSLPNFAFASLFCFVFMYFPMREPFVSTKKSTTNTIHQMTLSVLSLLALYYEQPYYKEIIT